MQSATHLGLCPSKVGILYQHISALLSLSTLRLPNGCALYHSPRSYSKMFLLLLSLVVFQLAPVLYQGFWRTSFYCFIIVIIIIIIIIIIVIITIVIQRNSIYWQTEKFILFAQNLVVWHVFWYSQSFLTNFSAKCLKVLVHFKNFKIFTFCSLFS